MDLTKSKDLLSASVGREYSLDRIRKSCVFAGRAVLGSRTRSGRSIHLVFGSKDSKATIWLSRCATAPPSSQPLIDISSKYTYFWGGRSDWSRPLYSRSAPLCGGSTVPRSPCGCFMHDFQLVMSSRGRIMFTTAPDHLCATWCPNRVCRDITGLLDDLHAHRDFVLRIASSDSLLLLFWAKAHARTLVSNADKYLLDCSSRRHMYVFPTMIYSSIPVYKILVSITEFSGLLRGPPSTNGQPGVSCHVLRTPHQGCEPC